MARALIGLAEKRLEFGAFEQFGFPGLTLDGNALIAAVEVATGKNACVAPAMGNNAPARFRVASGS